MASAINDSTMAAAESAVISILPGDRTMLGGRFGSIARRRSSGREVRSAFDRSAGSASTILRWRAASTESALIISSKKGSAVNKVGRADCLHGSDSFYKSLGRSVRMGVRDS